MGMYDYVDHECVCPACKNKVNGFQTKDLERELNTVSPGEVRNFYTYCSGCSAWIQFDKIAGNDFKRTVTGGSRKEDGIKRRYNTIVKIK